MANVSQIYALANSLKESFAGVDDFTIVDASSLVSFGDFVLNSSSNKEKFYNSLVDRIGKVVLSVKEVTTKNRGTRKNEFDWGAILQKITVEMGDFEQSTTMWDSSVAQHNPFTGSPNATATSRLFSAINTFQYKEVIPDVQIRTAFTDASSFNAFVSGIYMAMSNAFVIALDGLESKAINIGAIDTMKNAVSDEREEIALNILDKYNREVLGLTCTISGNDIVYPTGWVKVSQMDKDPGFLKYFSSELRLLVNNVKEFNYVYNIGEHGTKCDMPILEVLGRVANACRFYLSADTYNADLVSLPNIYNEVNFWEVMKAPGKVANDFDSASRINTVVTEEETEYDVTYNGIVAMLRDPETVSTVHMNRRSHSIYNPEDEVTNVIEKVDLGYAVDELETFVVWSVGDPTVKTVGSTKSVEYNRYTGLVTKTEKE